MTGGSGFIGAPLVRVLRERGWDVHSVSLRSPDWRARVRDLRPEVCYHLAWVARGRYLVSPENLPCLSLSLELLRELPEGTRFVGAGTCYELPWAPPTLYATCKNALREVAERTGRPVSWARIFYQYGPGEDSARLVPTVIRSLLEGKTAKLSEGSQVRDFLYVDDVARAIAAVEPGITEIGSGEGVSVREIALRIAKLLGRPDLLEFGAPTSEPLRIVADSGRLRATGWTPAVGLDEGLARTIEWWRR
ncbi:MAG: NAD(P)-dependent oxidoreductase [Planctomycetes bacterium]|nr:NAD(P)-dependent oxidoreductase [Planctomycetota bacterium]